MIIDTHTHIFPEHMAQRTLQVLKQRIYNRQGYEVEVYSDGTAEGLKECMLRDGVDISIAAPVSTKPQQHMTINRYARDVTDDKIISLAAVHPLQENKREVLADIAAHGFLGIKVHPEFQGVDVDSREFTELFSAAEELGLIVLMHAGEDIGVDPPVHSTPKKIRNLLNYVSGERIIAAHMGGWRMWDDVEEYLMGTPVYFDTAVVSEYMDSAQCKRIIKKHGADKVLFASDNPWGSAADTLAFLNKLGLCEEDMDKITYQNAKKLFRL